MAAASVLHGMLWSISHTLWTCTEPARAPFQSLLTMCVHAALVTMPLSRLPSVYYRQGTGFRVLSDEPQLPAPAARQAPIELPLPRQPQLPVRLPPCSTEGQVLPRSGEFSRDQMASIVAALEALLPSGASTPSSASNAPTPLDSDVEGKCL